MKTIKIDSHEFVKDENGGHFKVTTRYETYTDEQVRDNDLCTVCGSSAYPKCTEVCQGYEFLLLQQAREAQNA